MAWKDWIKGTIYVSGTLTFMFINTYIIYIYIHTSSSYVMICHYMSLYVIICHQSSSSGSHLDSTQKLANPSGYCA